MGGVLCLWGVPGGRGGGGGRGQGSATPMRKNVGQPGHAMDAMKLPSTIAALWGRTGPANRWAFECGQGRGRLCRPEGVRQGPPRVRESLIRPLDTRQGHGGRRAGPATPTPCPPRTSAASTGFQSPPSTASGRQAASTVPRNCPRVPHLHLALVLRDARRPLPLILVVGRFPHHFDGCD